LKKPQHQLPALPVTSATMLQTPLHMAGEKSDKPNIVITFPNHDMRIIVVRCLAVCRNLKP